MDLDAYRHNAESFITELMREYYRHYAGLKDSFEIEAIYAAHEGLFRRDAVHALRELDARSDGDGEGFYCACYLRAWALETHLRSYLRTRFGPAWFDSREAGEVLRGCGVTDSASTPKSCWASSPVRTWTSARCSGTSR